MIESKLNNIKTAYSLQDLLLVPQYSDLESREEVDITTEIADYKLKIPIFSSPMSTITEFKMAKTMYELGGAAIIHRFLPEEQSSIVKKLKDLGHKLIVVAISSNDRKRIDMLVDSGATMFCIDIAHGHTKKGLETIKYIREKHKKIKIMAGNIVTFKAARDLCDDGKGADILRVGIGGGSVCTTRIQTGVGVPNATALDSIYIEKKEFSFKSDIVLDGGIKYAGDIVKALALGADAVIIGNLIAATKETPGKIKLGLHSKIPFIYRYKRYAGMASVEEQLKYKGKKSRDLWNEGKSTHVQYKGPVKKVIEDIVRNVKSGFAYCGARNIKELREKAEFIKITSIGREESMPPINYKK
jgi:IMP dehydrogenase